jgi:hypothetical protein
MGEKGPLRQRGAPGLFSPLHPNRSVLFVQFRAADPVRGFHTGDPRVWVARRDLPGEDILTLEE